MVDRKLLLGLAIAGLIVPVSLVKCLSAASARVEVAATCHEKKKMDKDEEKEGKEDKEDDEHEGHQWSKATEEKEIEETVPMAMVPSAVLDAVKKEVPDGTITEAELEAKKHHIMYSFDVTAGEIKYDVKITVAGKFHSKEVDDDADENDEKPAAAAKP